MFLYMLFFFLLPLNDITFFNFKPLYYILFSISVVSMSLVIFILPFYKIYLSFQYSISLFIFLFLFNICNKVCKMAQNIFQKNYGLIILSNTIQYNNSLFAIFVF